MHVAVLRRKMSLGLRWVRDARTANASGGAMCHQGAGHHFPPEEEVQQGPDAAEPLRVPPFVAALLGGTTSPLRFRCNAENASYLEGILMQSCSI